jgi:predicted nucleic acid-binding protein
MPLFFDTNVHVDILRGALSVDGVRASTGGGPLRLSPVVAHELVRGARAGESRAILTLVTSLVPIEPPSWRECWLEAGRVLRDVFRDHEAVGLARLQNDVLLGLTARHTGAVFVTRDRHFLAIQKRVPFQLIWVDV